MTTLEQEYEATDLPEFDGSGEQLVYVIRWGNYVKIGCSVNPYDRLQRVTKRGARPPAQKAAPELIATIPGSYAVEAWLHTTLAEHRAVGEWFHLRGPVADLVTFAQTESDRAFATNPAGIRRRAMGG